MTDWREMAIGDLLTVKHGFAFKGEHFAPDGEELVLTPGNFPVGGGLQFREGKERYYTGKYPDEYRLSPGDLLVVMTDLKQDAPILGNPAFVPEGRTLLHNQRLGLVKLRSDADIDRRFLYYLLLADTTRRQLRATATGSTVRHTAPVRICSARCRIPPRDVQTQIGLALGAIDDLIENSRRRVRVLEEMARAIYREWFIHFRFPGHEDATFVDSDLGRIPNGWHASTCGEEFQLIGGGTPSKKEPTYWDHGTVDWYTPSDLTKSTPRYPRTSALKITEEGLARSSAKHFPAGTVMMTSRATLGVLAIATGPATTNQGFISVLPDSRWPANFIREFLDASAEQLAAISTGATFKEITKGAFKSFPFLVPEQRVLDQFRDATAAMEESIARLEASTEHLMSLRDLLLPKLVTGQIDVSDLDLDAVSTKAGA